MRGIDVYIENNKIIIKKIRARQTENDIEEIPLQLMEYGKFYTSKIKVTSQELKNKIFLIQTINKDLQNKQSDEEIEQEDIEIDEQKNISNNVIIVFSEENKIKYAYCSEEQAYKKILKFKYKVLRLKLNKRKIELKILAYIINKYNLEIKSEKLYIDQVLFKECRLKETNQNLTKFQMITSNDIYKLTFNMKDILQDENGNRSRW